MKPETLSLLAHNLREKIAADAKVGILRGALNTAGEVLKSTNAAGKAVSDSGHKVVGSLIKATPYIAAGVGAKKAYDSDTVQQKIYDYKNWKARRAQSQGQY